MPQIIPPVLFGLFLLSMVPVTMLCPGSPMLPAPFQWTGLAVVALGLFFLKKGHGTFLSQETEIHTFRQPTRLVTSGIYALSRNPMYLGFLLMLLGVAVCTNEALNVLFAIVFFLAAQFWYIPIEERNAEKTFGQPYLDYKKNVRRWL